MTDQDLFLDYIAKHYNQLKYKYLNFCKQHNYKWDEDIFSDTILKCYEAIRKKGKLNDTTPQGIENYMFIAFKLNIKREGQYARNTKRDLNVTSDDINEAYETWYNSNHITSLEKVKSDLFKDFSILYIMMVVEANFDSEHFYLFRIKTLGNLTYKQLQERTKIKASRQKVIDVKNWLKENVTKNDIKREFNQIYGNLIEN